MKLILIVEPLAYLLMSGLLIQAKTNLSPETHCIVTCSATSPLAYTDLDAAAEANPGFRAFQDVTAWVDSAATAGIISGLSGVIFWGLGASLIFVAEYRQPN